jgi:uncharacterized protein (DUF924 family)
MRVEDIINFWFNQLEPKDWFSKNTQLDQDISSKFKVFHEKVSQCELYSWRNTPEGALAEIIVLDQFSRNIYRDKPQSFQKDTLALALSQEAISKKFDRLLTPIKKSFFYMAFMHSESIIIHEQAVKLFKQEGLEVYYDFELKHKVIIDRFGRYPHRNKILGRESTAEESIFLLEPNSNF